MTNNDDLTTITLFAPAELKRELQAVARQNERSLSGEVRRAIVEHLAQTQTDRPAGERVGSAA